MGTPMKRTMLVLVLAVVVGLVALLIADRGVQPGRPDAEGVVELAMRDYQFAPDELFLPAETPLTIRIVNEDGNVHRVTFGRSVIVEDGLQFGFEEDLLADLDPVVLPRRAVVGGMDYEGPLEISIDPGEAAEIAVTIPEERVGEWEMGCFNACGAHYRAGLAGRVHVEPAP